MPSSRLAQLLLPSGSLGLRTYDVLEEAVFIGPHFTDADVKFLRHFPALRVVAFLDPSITDAAARAFHEDRVDVQVVVDATPRLNGSVSCTR